MSMVDILRKGVFYALKKLLRLYLADSRYRKSERKARLYFFLISDK